MFYLKLIKNGIKVLYQLKSNNYKYQLHNSNLDLDFGEVVFIGAEGENFDAKGFKPDIWIDSADALNATVKLIKNYKLD